MGELRQQPRAPANWKVSEQGPAPSLRPPHRAPRHIPSETVDLLHVEATGGTVS